jgi:hypothetical protein
LNCWRVPSAVWQGLPDSTYTNDPNEFKIALYNMNEVIICGLNELSENEQDILIGYIMIKSNYAKLTRKSNRSNNEQFNVSDQKLLYSSTALSPSNTDIVFEPKVDKSVKRKKGIGKDQNQIHKSEVKSEKIIREECSTLVASKFEMPVKGKNGAVTNSLDGKTIVLTGVFPEIGGGAGLNLGYD